MAASYPSEPPPDMVGRLQRDLDEQRQTIEELETPIVRLWDRVLAVPIVGSLDTYRTQQMNERLLGQIVATGSEFVILDISGAPVVDTAVAKHWLETVAAARLLGAEVFIVGMTKYIALTLVHLGLELSGVITTTTMAKGLALAFERLGLDVVPRSTRRAAADNPGQPGDR